MPLPALFSGDFLLPGLEPLLFTALNFFDALRHGQVLRHRAAQFVNGLADFAAHFTVNPVGNFFGTHVFAAQLILGLRCAEKIGRQFHAAHVVENVFLGFEPLPLMEVAHSQPAIQPPIAVIHENGVIHRLDDARLLRDACEILVVLLHLGAQQQPFLILLQSLVIGQFLPARLDGEIGLAQGDDCLGGIGVLDHQIPGIAGQHHCFHRTLPALADLDHFVDFNEMIFHALAAVETGGSRLLNHRLEIAVIRVFQDAGEFARGPEFRAGGIDALDALERVAGGGDGQWIAHGLPFTRSHGSDEGRIVHIDADNR